MFRHTFATSLLEADVDIRYIQEMLGHSSINITEIYTHVAVSKQRDILASKHPRKDFAIFWCNIISQELELHKQSIIAENIAENIALLYFSDSKGFLFL